MTKDYSPELGIAGGLLVASALVSATAHGAGARLLVFLHVAVKQRALQSELKSALAGVDVTAVGRIGDFERSQKEGVDAIVAIPAVLNAFKLNIKLQGTRGGNAEERYSIVGVGGEPDPGKIASIGAIDLLGRDGTSAFVKGMLGASPKIERVSKVEDLLPLLQMQRVDAVLLPSRLFLEIKSASKLTLVPKELSKPVGLPAAAVVTPAGEQVIAAIRKMPTTVAKTLGVDSWR